MQRFPLNKDKSPACSAWQVYSGGCSTPMFGVTPPTGYVVIDVDSYKNDNIQGEIEKVIGCSLDWEGSLLQTTMRGGTHHGFIIPNDVKILQGSDLLKVKGFDTRVSGKGYIASGEGYKVVDADCVTDRFDDFLPELPTKAIEALKVKTSVVTSGDNQLFRKEETLVTNEDGSPLTREQVIGVLKNLPDEVGRDNASWLTVCAGLKRQLLAQGIDKEKVNDRNGNGFKILSNWSRQRFDGNEDKWIETNKVNYTRWKSYNLDDEGDIVTFKSVISLARNSGGLPQDKAIIESSATAMIDDCPFISNYVMKAKNGYYINKETLVETCKAAYDNMHINETPLNAKGSPQKPSNVSIGLVEVVSDVMYAPQFEKVFTLNGNGRKYLNFYQEPRIDINNVTSEESEKALNGIKSHLGHLISNDSERDLVLHYLAHNVQKPGKKLPWGIILQGAPGDGKSFFAEMMRGVMGIDNVRIMNADTLQSSFTGWAAGQCMVFIEELKLDNHKKYEIVNRMKPFIANPTIEWTRKGHDPLTVPNTSNYIAFTNYKDSVPLDDSDRRYAVIFSKWQGNSIQKFDNDNKDYYPSLYENMRDSLPAIRKALLDLKIPDEFLKLNRAPLTEARRQMINMSRSPAQIDIEDAIDDFKSKVLFNDGKSLNITELVNQVKISRAVSSDDELYSSFNLSNSNMTTAILRNLNWSREEKRKKIEGKLCTIYNKNH